MPSRIEGSDIGLVHSKAMLAGQSYEEIRDKCLSDGSLFEDPYFPALTKSLVRDDEDDLEIKWLRPHEICTSPVWISGDLSRFDVVQGVLGDCWLLAATASLAGNKSLLERVVPPNQTFQDGYCGVFRFCFWYQGEWVDVVVDDRLPTINDQLCYMHSANQNEFWSALLEKAYAKLYGCYENLRGGNAPESLEDLTGGLAESIYFEDTDEDYLRTVMLQTRDRGGLLTCSMNPPQEYGEPVDVLRSVEGLLYNHAYSITRVEQVSLVGGKQELLVRIRNPWGNSKEWRGAWSDKSYDWRFVDPRVKRQLSVTEAEDGEFWMSFEDFMAHFTKVDLCNLDPVYYEDPSVEMTWWVDSFHNRWTKFVNAGGCINNTDSAWKNPQYRVTLQSPDDDADKCTMIVALMQKDRRRMLKDGEQFYDIGYVIYKVPSGYPSHRALDRNFFLTNRIVGKSGDFIPAREVCARHHLPPGSYVIVPSTYFPEIEADFLLRIFTEKQKISRVVGDITTYERDEVDGGTADVDCLAALVDVMEDVDAGRLLDILNSHFVSDMADSQFTYDVCRGIVALYDTELQGKLNSQNYKALCQDLTDFKTAFLDAAATTTTTGYINSYALRPTLASLGYHVSNNTHRALVLRYVTDDGNIRFRDFILSTLRLKAIMDTIPKSQAAEIDKVVIAGLCS